MGAGQGRAGRWGRPDGGCTGYINVPWRRCEAAESDCLILSGYSACHTLLLPKPQAGVGTVCSLPQSRKGPGGEQGLSSLPATPPLSLPPAAPALAQNCACSSSDSAQPWAAVKRPPVLPSCPKGVLPIIAIMLSSLAVFIAIVLSSLATLPAPKR